MGYFIILEHLLMNCFKENMGINRQKIENFRYHIFLIVQKSASITINIRQSFVYEKLGLLYSPEN